MNTTCVRTCVGWFVFLSFVTDDHPDLAALVPVAAAHHRTNGVVHHDDRPDLAVLHRPSNESKSAQSVAAKRTLRKDRLVELGHAQVHSGKQKAVGNSHKFSFNNCWFYFTRQHRLPSLKDKNLSFLLSDFNLTPSLCCRANGMKRAQTRQAGG